MICTSLVILFVVISPAKFAAIVDENDEWANQVVYENGTELSSNSSFSVSYTYSNNSIANDVVFYLYTKDTLANPMKALVSDSVLFGGNVDVTKPIKILIHGYYSGRDKYFAKTIREAYLNIFYYNIINVDWSPIAHHLYPSSRSHVPAVGKIVAQFIDKLTNQTGLKPEVLHVIGHSLGAHVSGVAGLHIKSGTLMRITGLDPAGPLFRCRDEERLKPSSAKFVDVIHTCGKGLGFYDTLGHVDFYPNHGTAGQPGCSVTFGKCSHKRAIELFAESLSAPDGFAGTKCDHWSDYIEGKCDKNDVAYMGEYVSYGARGKYWLRTSKAFPYALGPYTGTGGRSASISLLVYAMILLVAIPLCYW